MEYIDEKISQDGTARGFGIYVKRKMKEQRNNKLKEQKDNKLQEHKDLKSEFIADMEKLSGFDQKERDSLV